jgi:hypothetical protein
LKGVIKAGPAVEDATANDQAVEQHRNWNDDTTQAEPIRKIQRLTLDDPFHLQLGITRL